VYALLQIFHFMFYHFLLMEVQNFICFWAQYRTLAVSLALTVHLHITIFSSIKKETSKINFTVDTFYKCKVLKPKLQTITAGFHVLVQKQLPFWNW